MKKLLIIGHARHGKDTVAEIINKKFGYTFQSSSQAAADIFIYDVLKNKYHYSSPEKCFADRVNHRKEWHDLICEYNFEDKAKLAKEIMKNSDIYVGMRSNAELEKCLDQHVFNLVIGVYDPRKPLEHKSSFDIDIWKHCDIIIPNAGDLNDLNKKIDNLKELLNYEPRYHFKGN